MSETEHSKVKIEEMKHLKAIKKDIADMENELEEIKKTPSFSALKKEERKKALRIPRNHLTFLKSEEKRFEQKIRD